MDHQHDSPHLNPDSPVSFNATYPTKGQNVPVPPQPIPKHAASVSQCLPAGAPGCAWRRGRCSPQGNEPERKWGRREGDRDFRAGPAKEAELPLLPVRDSRN